MVRPSPTARHWNKNYRNFVGHIGWIAADGKLTNEGLEALHLVHQYGSDSRIFLDHIAKAVMLAGKHLVLINAINEFQDTEAQVDDEQVWLDAIEEHLEDEGLLRNAIRKGMLPQLGTLPEVS